MEVVLKEGFNINTKILLLYRGIYIIINDAIFKFIRFRLRKNNHRICTYVKPKYGGNMGKYQIFLKFTQSQMVKNALKLSTMVGEKFEIYLSQMAKNAIKLSTMVGEIKM